MTTGRRRVLHLLVVVAIGALLVLFARHLDWRAAAAAARGANPWMLLLAVMLNLLSLTLKGVRWWVFLRALGVRSLALVLRATYAGASLNNLVVAQGGEGARVLLVSRGSGVSSARVLAALALERALDAMCYLVLLVGAAWLLPLPAVITRWRLAATIALGMALLLLAWLLMRHRGGTSSAPHAETGGIRSYLGRFAAGVGEVASPGRLALGALLSLGAWALQVATYHVVSLATGSPLPLAGSVAALLAVGISFLIRATPGNVGVFQMVYALTALSFGIAEAPAVAVAVLIQIVQVAPVLVVGTLAAPVRLQHANSRV
jgi:glycosyltransferase 2 family protein